MRTNLIRHFALIFFLLLFCLFTNGQTPSVNVKSAITVGGGGKAAVKVNNISYGLPGSSIRYTISVDLQGASIKSAYYVFQGEDRNFTDEQLAQITDLGSVDLDIGSSETQNTGKYVLTAKVTLSTGDNPIIEGTDDKVYICSNELSANKKEGWTSDKKIVWNTDNVLLSVEATKTDNNCNLGYKWERGSTSLGTSASWNGKLGTDNINEDVTVKCTVYLYSPGDNNTRKVWNSMSFSQTFSVYRQITQDDVEIKAYYGSTASKDGKMYLCKGLSLPNRNIKVSLKTPFTSLSPEAVGIQWKKGGANYGDTKSFNCEPEPYSGNISSNGSFQEKYSVAFKYQPHTSLTAQDLVSDDVTVITYNNPSFVLKTDINSDVIVSNKDVLVVWNDTNIGINNETQGGNSSSWSYSWTQGSNKSTSRNYAAKTYAVDATHNSSSYAISLVIENKDPNGQSMFKETCTFNIESWKKPTNKGNALVNRIVSDKTDTKNIIYLYPNYSNEYGSRYFEIPDLGLNPDYWRSRWYVNDDLTSNTTKFFYPINEVDKTCSVVAEVTYEPDNLLAGLQVYKETKNLQIIFLDKPQASIEEWKHNDGFSGKHIDVWETTVNQAKANTSGGSSWEYNWLIDEKPVSSGSLTPDQSRWSDKLSVKGGSDINSVYQMSLLLTNKDPDGVVWFRQSFDAVYTVYKEPHPYVKEDGINKIEKETYKGSKWTVIKVYKGFERNVLLCDSTTQIDNTDYKWNNKWKYGNSYDLYNKGLVSKPFTDSDIDFHDRKRVESCVELECQTENMADSVAYRDIINFISIFWPTPDIRICSNKDVNREGFLQYDDGDSLKISIEVTDCIDDDSLGWSYRISKKNATLTTESYYKELLQNEADHYNDDTLYVKITNLLDKYGTDNYIKDTLVKVRVNPPFNIVNDSVRIAKSDIDTPKHYYTPYFDTVTSTYYSMLGCGDISFPVHHTKNKTIYYNPSDSEKKWNILINGNSITEFNITDDTLLIDKSVYSAPGQYQMEIYGWLKVNGSDDYKQFSFLQSPMVYIYEKPMVSPVDFDPSIIYAVWDTTMLHTTINCDFVSTNNWETRWFRTSSPENVLYDGDDFIGSTFCSYGIDNLKSSDTIRFIAVCYAPDKKTIWYKDSIDRKLIIWRHPELEAYHYFDRKMDNVPEKSWDEELNVCDFGAPDQSVTLKIKAKEGTADESITWADITVSTEGSELIKPYHFTSSTVLKLSRKYQEPLNDYYVFDSIRTVHGKASIPVSSDYQILGGDVSFKFVFRTKVWQRIRIVDLTDYYYTADNKAVLVVQSPNNMPKPILSKTIIYSPSDCPFTAPEFKYVLKSDDNLDWDNWRKWSDVVVADNESKTSCSDSVYTVRCKAIGQDDGLDWSDDAIDFEVVVYPQMSVTNYVKELRKDNEDDYYSALIVGDSINLITEHSYDFGQWAYTDLLKIINTGYNNSVCNTILSNAPYHANLHNLTYKLDKDADYLNPEWSDYVVSVPDSLILTRHIDCKVMYRDKNGKACLVTLSVKGASFTRGIHLWPYDSVFTPDKYVYNADSMLYVKIHQGLENSTYLRCDHEMDDNYNNGHWTYNWNNGKTVESIDAGIGRELKSKEVIHFYIDAVYQPEAGVLERHYPCDFYLLDYPTPDPLLNSESIRSAKEDIRQVDEGVGYTYELDSAFLKTGNPEGWMLKWTIWYWDNEKHKPATMTKTFEKDKISYDVWFPVSDDNIDKMKYQDYTYSVEYYNIDPNDPSLYWVAPGTYSFKKVTVYRRPVKPRELLKKGGATGKSNIFIASEPFGKTLFPRGVNGKVIVPVSETDQDNVDQYYKDNKYYFEFGDSYGSDTITEKRYYQYRDPIGIPWVRTVWKYLDGKGNVDYISFSDTVYYSGSQQAATRAAMGELVINIPSFSAEFEEPVKSHVFIYDSNGKVVRATDYGFKAIFDESLDLSGLESGLYLIRFEIGDIRETRKVLIK